MSRKTRNDGQRPDASMSLINDLFANPLEEDYYAAAQRGNRAVSTAGEEKDRTHGGLAAIAARGPAGLLVGLALLGVLFTTAALQVQQDAVIVSAERTALIERVTEESARHDQLTQRMEELSAELLATERAAISSSDLSHELDGQVATLQGASGFGPVTGPGIVVELDDTPPGAVPEGREGVILDIDIRIVVNGLWAAGAEAVSVNGERITPLSSIRRADTVIRVNVTPIGPPYLISVIGDSRTLGTAFADSPAGDWLRHFQTTEGILWSVGPSESLTLPAGAVSLTYARPKENS